MMGAPAGQLEFAEWARLLGGDGAAIPFLRYGVSESLVRDLGMVGLLLRQLRPIVPIS
jgi:hypothetical protein